MPSPSDRFYLLQLPSRPAWWGDLGNRLTIAGLVLEGEGVPVTILTPGAAVTEENVRRGLVLQPTLEEWSDIIRASDDPSVFILDETNGIKAIHRKTRYIISGDVQQRVWRAYGFKCFYCDREMGDVQLTIDHFYPLEQSGANDETNYVSACRSCNKQKGNMSPQDWCKKMDIDFGDTQLHIAEAAMRIAK